MNLLDVERIRQPIPGQPLAKLDHLEVFAEIESTNNYLLDQPAPPAGRFRVALAEHQTAGRGRRDRPWHSPRSSGLCMSMSYTFNRTPDSLPCVTLAIGIGVAQALEYLGVRGIGLKWPNDLVVRDGKLGGILTEVRPTRGKGTTVVSGIGINVDLQGLPGAAQITSQLGHVSDLATCVRNLPTRSAISAVLIEGLFNTLAEFDADGFGRFADTWEKFDWLRGQQVSIERPDRVTTGTCQGIDADGALIMKTANGQERILSGSVHLHDNSATNS
jgi:BirA family transcriptional regulator, biotin operon repressor / biotin---[acetyl-CoA-carboxylase] ligase